MFKLISFLLLIISGLADSNPQYDPYEKQLLKIVGNIQSGITTMTKTGNQAISTGSLFSSSQTLSTQVYIQSLNEIRNQIATTLSQSTIPYTLKTWNCTSVPDAEYNNLLSVNNQLQSNKQSLTDNLKALSSYSNCTQVDQMNIQAKLLDQELKIVQNQSSQFCRNPQNATNGTSGTSGSGTTTPGGTNQTQNNGTGVNQTGNNPTGTTTPGTSGTNNNNTHSNNATSATNGGNNGTTNGTSTGGSNGAPTTPNAGFVNNLDNGINNWIYGNINSQSFYADVNKKIQSGAKLCPSQNPYIDDNNNCISCPILYNVAAKTCASCPSGSNLNPKIHQCDTSSGETIIKNSNPGANNFIGKVPQTIADLSSCPSSAPYFNGNQCINCQLPNYFDYTNSVCLTCGNGLQFDVNAKICKPLNNSVNPQISKLNSNLASSVINYAGTPPSSINGANSCPISEPYFNGMNCISCTLPLFFNFSSQVCSACDTSDMFDIKTKTCVLDPTKIYYSNSLNGVSNYIGNPPILADTSTKVIRACPPQTPFSTGKQCIQCSPPSFYNFQANQCQKCSNSLVFSSESKGCIAKQTDGSTTEKNSNIEKISNFMFTVPQYNESLETCDSNAPYFNGGACISCSLPSYFDFKTFNCESCPPDQSFNVQNRLCEYTKQRFISDTTNPDIYYNGNYQAYAGTIDSKRFSDPSIQVCPSNTPFYQTTTNQCISCPSDQPIFNIKYSKCISCGSDSSFDPYSRICIYNKKVGLTLERTLMNTFSF